MTNTYMEYPFNYAKYFIPEFIERMRKNSDCVEKPSPRQGINIARLLLPAYFRKGHLKFQEILDAAVVTSRIENQSIAEKTAAEILANMKDKNNRDLQKFSKENQLLNVLSDVDKKPVYLSPHGKGLENDYAANHNSEVDLFESYENKPDLGVGPGEDKVIKMGVKTLRKHHDDELLKKLTSLIRKKLIELGSKFKKGKEWSKKTILRPYQKGDDPDKIDEEKSLENILNIGRAINEIRYDDFLIRKKRKKNNIIVYILDISNTMFYEYDGINSISYSLMCLIPLIWGLQNERYGISLYESNTHIVKHIDEEKSAYNIIDNLMEMFTLNTMMMEKKYSGKKGSMTWGGTIPNKSFDWSYNKFFESNQRNDKLCFIFSDFILTEPGNLTTENKKVFELLKKMIDLDVDIFACVSPLTYKPIFNNYSKYSLNKLTELGVNIIKTSNSNKFLDNIIKNIN